MRSHARICGELTDQVHTGRNTGLLERIYTFVRIQDHLVSLRYSIPRQVTLREPRRTAPFATRQLRNYHLCNDLRTIHRHLTLRTLSDSTTYHAKERGIPCPLYPAAINCPL